MKRLAVGLICVIAGVALVLLLMAVFRHRTPAATPQAVPVGDESHRSDGTGRQAPPSQSQPALPADPQALAGDQPAASVRTAAALPTLNALGRLAAATEVKLHLTEVQLGPATEAAVAAERKADAALSGLRARQQALRDRLAALGTEDTTGAAVTAQKELAKLMAEERRQLAALDLELRNNLTPILSAEQMQALNSMAEGDGPVPGPALGEQGGRPPAAPVR